jgi:outer membrane immunogenic protein
MKKFVFALLAGTALVSAPALAADLGRPVYKAPVAVAAPYMTWNGFYIGGNVGYGWGESRASDAVGSLGRFDTDGFAGGGQIGYNWQFSPNWVFGIEADIQGADIKGGNVNYATSTDMYGTVRGRLGYAFNNVLFYGTGGFAWGRTEVTDVALTGGTLTRTGTGYAVGGGLEYAFAPQWSAKVEYLYVNLGREAYDFGNATDPIRARTDFSTVKFGVNYRFGGGPIVASY